MLRYARLLVAVIAPFVLPAVARAQQCPSQPHPAFEFQVESPARFIPDSSRPRPAANPFAAGKDDPNALIVQFVVDTMGIPLVQTFKALKAPSAAVVDSVRAVLPGWRFTPSRTGPCKLMQLVQTTVDR